jgi:hypothetical protein
VNLLDCKSEIHCRLRLQFKKKNVLFWSKHHRHVDHLLNMLLHRHIDDFLEIIVAQFEHILLCRLG